MSEPIEVLQRKIKSATELGSIVRTMKALAAVSILQYEQAVRSLSDYYRALRLSLFVCFRPIDYTDAGARYASRSVRTSVTGIVFGSDQGLVGQFNDTLSAFVIGELAPFPREREIWAVGEHISARLKDLVPQKRFYSVPNSVATITPLVSQILVDCQARPETGEIYIFHNQPVSGTRYEPVKHRLLPLDATWRQQFSQTKWPTKMLPEILGTAELTLPALIREYLFVSLFKACAESLASENASRLAAMQRAQRNIEELLDGLRLAFNQRRQAAIDEELFDVISGFEALADHRQHWS